MDLTTLLGFMAIVAVASYVQTVTGFALGLITMGAVSSLNLTSIAFASAVISILALCNTTVALRGALDKVHWPAAKALALGVLPATAGGVLLLEFLSEQSTQTLKLLLGWTIIIGGIVLVLKPSPFAQLSSSIRFTLFGILGGTFGGLFSVSGPPLVYQMYRQPLSLEVIRNTLLTIFALSTMVRTLTVASQGGLTREVLLFSLLIIPLVMLVTRLAKRYPPTLADHQMRRIAFLLLMGIGITQVLAVSY